MPQGPGGHVSREEYLLGRKIDKALEQLERSEADEAAQEGEQPPPQQNKSSYTIEHGESRYHVHGNSKIL